MHHLYPLAKGDPLCPLGFHPQVRWPTRCKRCFRDYKEHGGKRRDEGPLRRDDTTLSTPSLSWNSKENDNENKRRSWVSSSNLAASDRGNNDSSNNNNFSDYSNPSSWISTPDLSNLEDDTQAVTVNLKLPRRKPKPVDTGQRTVSDSFSLVKNDKSLTTFNKNDSLATRAKKLQAIKETSTDRGKRIQIKEVRTISDEPTNHDVQFLIQVKSKPLKEEYPKDIEPDDETASLAGTETTDTTLVDIHDSELREQLESMKKELDLTKTRCDKLEREKSDILLRRLAAMETTTSKTTASEVLKLQKKCNEMQQQLEDYRDEKKSLTLKVRELEQDIELRPTAQDAQKIADELRSKLLAAETLCEELMDENEDMKKEIRDMEEQMDELQDNFREDQAMEYTSIKKELDQTTKNCRILSFKLRKSERKAEQLEFEKADAEKKLKEISGGVTTLNNIDKIKQLEQEVKVSNEVSLRLQKELEEATQKLSKFEESSKSSTTKKKAPMLGSIGKVPSGDGKVSRESLTRGGSQDDPVQLLRDLQDSLEREADLREQLKFAEEEAQNLRKKVSRIEDDNESLVLQLKKMAGRARSRKLSPTSTRLTPELPLEKGDTSDDEDPAELKLQLELSEQEASVLRKKVEEFEVDNHRLKAKTKELQEKCNAKTNTKRTVIANDKSNSLQNQKLKVLEDETNDLRKKLIEKERDCERLHAELSLTQKRSKGIQKSKSLDLDQQTLDLKRQLQVIEQETTVLRNKVQTLEEENEKLSAENKRFNLLRGTKNLKSDRNIDKYIDQIAALEIDLAESNKRIKELEETLKLYQSNQFQEFKGETQYKRFIQRTPKKFTSTTSKDQLKSMVGDLENEISEMLLAIKSSENERIKLEEEIKKLKQNEELEKLLTDLKDLNAKISSTQKELSEEKLKTKDLNKTLKKTKESLERLNDENKTFREQTEELNKEHKKIIKEKDALNEEVNKLKTNLKTVTYKQDELTLLTQKLETAKINMETKEKELNDVKKELNGKAKLIDEFNDKCTKIPQLEKQITEYKEKLTKCDKNIQDQNKDFENEMEKEKEKVKSLENNQSKLTSKWDEERNQLNSQIEELNSKINSLESTIENKNKSIKKLEENLSKEKENLSKTNLKAGELTSKEINKLKDELAKTKANLSDLESKLDTSRKTQQILEDKLKKSESDNKHSKLEYEKKCNELDIDLQNEKKKIENLKASHEKENKNKELELGLLRNKIKKLENNSQGAIKKDEVKQLQESIEKLEKTIASEKQKYDDLTAKYEILEEEHVVTKAKLVMEKETLESQLANVRRELEKIETELRTLRDTYNIKQDTWIKEKLELQEKLKELSKRNQNNGSDLEKARLKASLEGKQSELDQIKKEYDVTNDQMEFMRKENDELKKKLDDYEKVNKIQRNISADSSAMDKEIRQLKMRLTNAEKSKKSDLAECKMRYEGQLNIMTGEIQSLQNQVVRFKREKDTYKHMLESAQKTIGELKHSPKTNLDNSKPKSVYYDELEESKTKVVTLEQQINCMEDELSEARLECSRLKTELVSERSSWEVKLSELHSRVNELEEEKILNSGRTKIAGIRTRMELAWQKEREEQQRLLQETATLARDLRQTLFEVERERDKEKLESKRKQDQFKKNSEEDQDENRKKITELQCDLLELRDAHAKLRTTNEKLRREKERYEKEREELKSLIGGKKRADQEDERRVQFVIEQMDILKQVAPELFFSHENEARYTPTPPRRTKSKSRETSPALDRRENSVTPEDKQQQIQYIMQRLVSATEDLRKMQSSGDDDIDRERIRRTLGVRRATSTEHENSPSIYSKPFVRRNNTTSSLYRKSLSLEHNIQSDQNIWKNDDSMSSLQSLEMSSDVEASRAKRDASLDSRISNESTQSDYIGEKKKKKGLMGKLRTLTKSRSIDDQDPGTFSPSRPLSSRPNSNTDMSDEIKGSKKDLKERITGIFKRGGSSSRSNSVERAPVTSTQRPLMRNSSNGNVSQPQTDADKKKFKKSSIR